MMDAPINLEGDYDTIFEIGVASSFYTGQKA